MREGPHAVVGIGHYRSQPGHIQPAEPAAHLRFRGQQPGRSLRLGSKQPVLHRQRRKSSCDLLGAGLGLCGGHAAGEADRPLEPPLSQGTGQHSQHVPPAGLKPGQGQVIRVAAKSCNVLPYPIQRLGNIQQRKIPGSIRTGAKSGETVEPQQSQAVVYRHHHTFRPLHQAVTTQLLGRAGLVAAAMEKDQYRPAPGAGCGIDVQPQAVLHTGQTAAVLTGFRPGAGAVPHCRPGHRVQRSLPAALAARRFAIRDAVKCKAALLLLAQDRAILGLDLGGNP